MNQLEEVKRGEEAERLMEHPLFKEALEGIKGGIVSAMQSSAMGDETTHNRLVIALQLISQIERNFKTIMETGKMAKIQLNKETTISRMKKAAGF